MSYTYHANETFETTIADWDGQVVDEDGFIIFECWNNGDDGGNFYIWHDRDAKWAIERDACERFPSERPMDEWLAELKGNDDQATA
jgi:hypothetical protein